MTTALKGAKKMTKIEELEIAVTSLPAEEYSQFRRWFFDCDWEKWDREIEADAESGKLDFLLQEAAEAKKNHQWSGRAH
jgi:hypothetical protein